ncbi:hemolysin family protein [Demequina sp.]|uniref:hemolysin family protein n=1 Tax=Demequina sp. TaxID=2050685 RepID=UPI003D14A25A
MTGTEVTVLIVVGVLALLGAGALHALVAAFEQLPYADERRMASALRPDGRPTSAARLAVSPGDTDNSASVAYATLEALGIVCWTLLAVGMGEALGWPGWVFSLVAAVVAAFLSLIVVRALPRSVGRTYPETTVRAVAPLARLLIVLTTPVRRVVPALRAPALAEPEDLVDRAHEALDEEDVELVQGVVNLGETLAREVMVPRTDMITIQRGTTLRKALSLFMRSGFSRVPVIAGGVDDVAGVLYFKDVVRETWDSPAALDEVVDAIMREPEFVPESLAVDDLLRRMQNDVFHIAIVVDEFGGVAGLVTIEDALEEIVGELTDEHDRAEPEPEMLAAGGYRVPSRMALDELGELFDVEIEDEDVDTVGGLLSKALGRVPIPGASASAHGLVLTADRFEGRRRRLSSVVVRPEEVADE